MSSHQSSTNSEQQNTALHTWLAQTLPDYTGHFHLEKFAAGQSNPSFLLDLGYNKYVLRRKPAGELLASAHAVDREFRLISALQHTDVAVPTPIALCEDNNVIGSMFYLMSYEDGDILWDPALPEVTAAERPTYYQALVESLARLHRVDYHAVGLGDFGRPGNYYERQLSRWAKQYQASATSELPQMDALIQWLQAHLPEDDGQCSIIHGDYRLDNVIFYRGEARIRAVLDWELATLGHPMADLAYYCMALRLPRNGEIKGLMGEDLTALNIPDENTIIRHYCTARGIEAPEHWTFYLAFSFFRLAAILQGVYKRGLDGNASSDKAIRMGRLVAPLAAQGLRTTLEE
ncbi:phosphotransferase family protein [Pseudohongiella sp.]|uniref:Aminoglycoside phosphotransferase domain-containing protein n=1 Tax=marine sediment metagenome TaxID=412755 RepID=A0A0F9VJS7_9ZZZZ|nr:phosphotransferase family protein [Pseudohongiella sp.]HDZ10464.1 phosphotransferase family protein [Pseudohongiella sp.]HEA62199.1 phosphotransferase family protein [Pseudohongiella sp.]